MVKVVTRQVRGKWQFGRIMPNGETYWYVGVHSSEKNAHRAAEKRIEGYRYQSR